MSTSLLAAKFLSYMLTFLYHRFYDSTIERKKGSFSYQVIVQSYKMLWHWRDAVALER